MSESFILFTEYMEHMELLTMEQRGILFTAIMAYEIGDPLPEMDIGVKMAFSFIKANLDRSDQKYKDIKRKRSAAGIASAEARRNKSKQEPTNLTCVECVEQEPTNPTKNKNKNMNKNKNLKDIKRFVRPSVDDVRAYCRERGNHVNPESFIAFYDSNGWKVGKNPMKDWKAAVRTWEQRERPAKSDKWQQQSQRTYDYGALEKQLLGGAP